MDGPWEKYQAAPAAPDAGADGPWAKYQTAPAPSPAPAPAAAAPSEDAPDLAPPAPGVNLYQNGTLATPAPAPPPAPAEDGRQTALDVQAADKGAVADLAGLPVDLTAGALNAGLAGVNVAGHALGNPNDVLPYIRDPVGGSENLSQVGAAANSVVGGPHVYSPAEMTPQELARYRTVEMAANAASTEGLGSLFSKLGRLALPPEVAPATNGPQVFRGAPSVEHVATPTAIGTAAAAGAGAGAAQSAYEQHVSPVVKKIPFIGPEADALLDALSGYGGAVGASGLTAAGRTAARVASVPVRAIAERVMPGEAQGSFTLQNGAVAAPKDLDAAATLAQRAAINPQQAAENIAATTNALRAQGPVVPTAGAMSADPGLIGLEQKQRLEADQKPAFIQNDKRVQQAAVDAASQIAPPSAVGRTFTDTANAMQAARVAAAQGGVDATQQQIDHLEAERANVAQPVAAARNTQVPASQALDKTVVDQTLLPMQEKNAAMYAAVDPNKQAIVSADPLLDAAAAVKSTLGDFNNPDKVIPKGLLSRIEATAPDNKLDPDLEAEIAQMSPKAQAQIREQLAGPAEPAETSIGDIVQVYPELATTEQRARRAGNYTLADNIRTLRGAMDDVISHAAENGDPAGQAALMARENWQKTLGTVFSDGPGGPATQLRKNFNLDRFGRSTAPPENTAGQFLQAGQPQKAESLKTIINASADPASGQRAAGQYLAADLAGSGALDAQGHLNPQAIANWRAKWGESTLDTAPDFKKQLDSLQQAAATGKDQASQLAQQLRTRQAALQSAQQNDTAFKSVVGASPANAVAGIFASKDPEATMKEIVGQIGSGTAAHDGLKAAVREYLTENATTSALQKTSTGTNPLSFAKLDTLFKQNEKTLAQVFSPEEMNKLQAAHSFLSSLKNLEQQSLAGSATAERQSAQERLWKIFEIGLKARYGGLEGGNKLRNIKLAATLQGGGPNVVNHLLGEMQFNPELAGALLTRKVKNASRDSYDAKLFDSLVVPAATARNNITPESESQPAQP
jgi:hypothetical protein